MIKKALKQGQLYVNYLGPLSALLGNLIATPILISNLGLKEWSLFGLINILLPLVYLLLFGSGEFVKRLMINIFLGNEKTRESIHMFYKYEKKNFIRLIPAIIILSLALIFFNSNSYESFKSIKFSFILISIAVLIKIFEFYYAEILNGLKEHYNLHFYAFIITACKWATIIYLSFLSEINVNVLLLAVIIFSCFHLTILRIFILNVFSEKKNQLINKNKKNISEFNKNNFGMIIFLLLMLQQFYKVITFGILDPISISYFGIAFMLSTAVPFAVAPIIVYLTPEIYETAEINSIDRKKHLSRLIILQFIILIIPLIIINLFLEKIIYIWLGDAINVFEISTFLIPLSIITLSISLFNSLKILFIAENKINLMKRPLVFVFCFFVILTIGVYMKFIIIENYLYCYSISMFLLMIYFYSIFFLKNIHSN